MTCKVEGCTRPVYARSLCRPDYDRQRLYGDPQHKRTYSRVGQEQRFWSKVNKTDSCWLWTGGRTPTGYGKFWTDEGHTVPAHRFAYELLVGQIPQGREIDHTCHNADISCSAGTECVHRRCVNPAHLEAVTNQINTDRGRTVAKQNVMKTHCPQGHPYDEANTYRIPPSRTLPNGGRGCKTCRRESYRRWAAKKSGR